MGIEKKIFLTCKRLLPIYRSITGPGNLKTLKILKKINTSLKILNIKSGSKVYDWRVPKVWQINNASITDENNKKILDFKKNFLHVVGYSIKVKKKLNQTQLLKKIHTLKNQPDFIPYVTSYYKKNWGFCMSENQKRKIPKGNYQVYIDTKFSKGNLNIGEIYLPGKLKKEILLTTYICHPQMLNNEISGPSVLIHLSNWIKKIKNRKFSYRILFSSETIGTISYIKKRYKILKSNVIAGYVLSCVGDDRCYSYIKTKNPNSLSNIIALKNLGHLKKKKKKIYSWLQRGSDERQFNSPGVDLNIGGLSRSKYGEYREYHTSADNFKVVSKNGLITSYNFFKKIIIDFEKTIIPQSKILCEPFLTKYDLISSISKKDLKLSEKKNILNLVSYCDSSKTLEMIAGLIKLNIKKTKKLLEILKSNKIVEY